MDKTIPNTIKTNKIGEKLLLHACCAPCSLKPYEILNNAGWNITIFYSNDNIYPEYEYHRRFEELQKWANNNNIKVIKDTYNPDSWNSTVPKFGEAPQNTDKRKLRCGACYYLRLERAAKYACKNNISYLASSLAVSPYQYNDVLEEKLKDICSNYNLRPIFMDFRPFYSDATQLSRDLGMYRQKYCGCEFSFRESYEQFKQKKNNKYLQELDNIKSKA